MLFQALSALICIQNAASFAYWVRAVYEKTSLIAFENETQMLWCHQYLLVYVSGNMFNVVCQLWFLFFLNNDKTMDLKSFVKAYLNIAIINLTMTLIGHYGGLYNILPETMQTLQNKNILPFSTHNLKRNPHIFQIPKFEESLRIEGVLLLALLLFVIFFMDSPRMAQLKKKTYHFFFFLLL